MAYEWFDAPAERVIRDVADCDRLTFIVGAGTSVEAGLPDWSTLVNRLLVSGGQIAGLDLSEAQSFAAWSVSSEGTTGAGEIARHALGKAFDDELHRALYSGLDTFLPGSAAEALARLYVERSEDVFDLLTTNYDDLLEDALRHELKRQGLKKRVRKLTDDQDIPSGEMAVRHLHGLFTSGGQKQGTLVLSDRDYYIMQDPTAWQESFFRGRLQANRCVFVGTSLADPNLLRYLYRAGGQGDHVAVFSRQQDARQYDSEQSNVVKLREESRAARWRAMGVTPVIVDYYSQSTQLLWEIETATRRGIAYVPLVDRLRSWWDESSSGILATAPRSFSDNQDRFHSIVKALWGTGLGIVRSAGHHRGPGEKLQMSLWVYQPERDELLNWASSDRVWRDPSTLDPVPVDWSSDFVASQAFCSGTMVSRDTESYAATRWNHVVGFPVYSYSIRGRLPVGAITLASNRPMIGSVFHRAEATVRNQVIPQLAKLAGELLEPRQSNE